MKSIVLAFLAFLAAAGLQRRVVPASSPASVPLRVAVGLGGAAAGGGGAPTAAVLGAGGVLLLGAGAPVLEGLGGLLVEDGLLHGGAHLGDERVQRERHVAAQHLDHHPACIEIIVRNVCCCLYSCTTSASIFMSDR